MGYRPVGKTDATMRRIRTGVGAFHAKLDILPLMKQDSVNFKADIQPFLQLPENRAKMLGATRGGGEFRAVPNFREIPIDDVMIPPKALSGWTVSISSTALEVYLRNVMLMGPFEIEASTGAVIAANTIEDKHYISNITHIGEMLGNNGFQIIDITRCLNSDGLVQALANQGEGTLPFTFTGNQVEDPVTGLLGSPFRMWFFDRDGKLLTYDEGEIPDQADALAALDESNAKMGSSKYGSK